uniref:alpha/beta hydrolase n=1 Tax=Marinobacterium profundum TaxID=1714300 RepID=UPI000832CFFE|nr:alpha/beta hydrolase [Marinobacterium profundum]
MRASDKKVAAQRVLLRLFALVFPSLAAKMLEARFLTPGCYALPEWEKRLAETASIRWCSTTSGKPFPVYSWGEGPVVVLVHGWSSRGTQLGRFIAPLVQQGFSVVTFDAPGHGLNEPTLTGLPEMIAATERVFADHGQVAGVIAHSLGTVAVSAALSRLPSVTHAVYIAPPEEPGRYLAQAGHFLNMTSKVISLAQKRIEHRFQVNFEELNHLCLAQAVEGRVLVVHDQCDKEVNHCEGVRIAQALPRGELLSVEGFGHRRILQSSDVVAIAVKYLGGCPRMLAVARAD